MKDQFHHLLEVMAESPFLFGVVAAIARWLLGDRSGGWWMFCGYLFSALVVAWGVSLYVADEPFTSNRRGFYVLLFAFAARDILTAVMAVSRELAADPVVLITKIKAAMRGKKQ